MNAQPNRLSRFISVIVLAALILSFIGIPAADSGSSYIVRSESAAQAAQLVEDFGGQVTSRLEIIQGVGAILSENAVERLRAEPEIVAVVPNGSVASLDASAEKASNHNGSNPPATDYPDVVGADLVWQNGVTGEGVTVAVLDSGVEMHNSMIGSRLIGFVDLVDRHKKSKDPNGHGTHVAGIIANSAIGEDGEFDGVAPGVNLVAVRVLDKYGFSTYERVIQGIQWVSDHKDEYDIRVLNISLVAPVQSPYWEDPLNLAVTYAWSQGIVVVAAAGNAGPDPVSVGVPANNPYVITVGAFTDNYTPADWSDDYIAPFSSAGPTMDAFVKPDLVAPGGHIISSQKPGTVLWKTYPDARVSPFYFKMAGTSQAAAVTSGVAALVIAANPTLTNDEVKYRLMATALPWADENLDNLPYSLWQQGMGRLNAPDAVFTVITGTANVGLDILADLAGTAHFQGYTEFNPETNEFTWGGGLGNWSGGLGNWSGAEGSWSGGLGNWSGGFGNWSGGLGNWSGGLGNWSGGLGNWSGGLGNWSGGLGNWSGGLGNWSGAMGDWSGGFGNWSGSYEGWDDLSEWPENVLIPGSVVTEP